MKVNELIKIMDELFPQELCDEWDNSGSQVEFTQQDVDKIFVTLELSRDTLEEALSNKANMIVTHHPLIFGGIDQISDEDPTGRYVRALLSNGISVYSAHTNFDRLVGGNNDYLGELLGISNIQMLDFLRTGSFDSEMKLSELIQHISEALDIPLNKIRAVGYSDILDKPIKNLAWCTGSGGEFIKEAVNAGADIYITGDIKYHDARLAAELGLPCIDIGHFGSEKIFIPNMARILKDNLEGNIKIIESQMDVDPFL